MKYREQLPEGCPPENAEIIVNERIVYRLIRQEHPTNDDFKSQQATNPSAKFRGVTKCQALGLSVHSSIQDSEKLRKLGKFRKHKICHVSLKSGAGKILQTGSYPSHHTWWPFADYDILANCHVEEQ